MPSNTCCPLTSSSTLGNTIDRGSDKGHSLKSLPGPLGIYLVVVVLGVEPGSHTTLGKRCTTELRAQPFKGFLETTFLCCCCFSQY
jgi:hypothetical protein